MTHSEGGRPVEIFGYPIWNNSDDAQNARQACWCPFMERRCTRTTRLTGIPTAVYELIPLHDRLVLKLVRFTSTSMDEIDRALRVSLVTLSKDEFVESLNRQWVKTIKHELRLAIARKIREKQATSF